jgi:transglutaminase-like putative cysteine protease
MNTIYQIEYHTQNTYEKVVKEALFEFIVTPCRNTTQETTQLTFYNSLGEEIYHYNNTFGFQLARIRSVKPFKEFEFRMKATVQKIHQNPYAFDSIPIEEEIALLSSSDFYIDHHIYLESTIYTTISDAYMAHILYRQQESIFDYLSQLNQYVYDMLAFDPDPTDVHTTVNEVIGLKKGVCQDYAHLFIAIARKNRIPCRYVSGYLNQGGTLMGSAVMHAWVEAFIPGHGWHGFDPTNNLLADMNHIKVAHGVDYSDCSPIKGVLKTTGGNTTTYHTKVIPQELQAEVQ